MRNDKPNPIVELSFQFALDIIEFTEVLEKLRKFVIAKQLLKSGTSIGANVRESQNAESKVDFIHKLKLASKEADETDYWLALCKYSKGYPDTAYLTIKLNELTRIMSRIIATSKKNLN